jgi:hypothetical protein
MSKLAILVATFALTACASTSEWRTLTMDGSSEAAFEESISLLDQELPKTRNRMFALALVDIVRTGAEEAGETDGSAGSSAFSAQDRPAFTADARGRAEYQNHE